MARLFFDSDYAWAAKKSSGYAATVIVGSGIVAPFVGPRLGVSNYAALTDAISRARKHEKIIATASESIDSGEGHC
jgi:hypothetical protein